jgi:hypothetical protein
VREVTERDMRDPQFGPGDPSEFEFRDDGSIARKDRWEMGIRKIAGTLGLTGRERFEITDVVARVNDIVGWLQHPVAAEEEEI